MGTVRRLASTASTGLRMRHQVGRALLLRDLSAFLRLEVVGALAMSGLTTALRTPGTATELADRAGLSDVELTAALLDLAVVQRQVGRRGDVYRIRGRRLRAVAGDRAPDATGLAEEATAYGGPVYAGLVGHLAGAPKAPYDAGLGDVIARVSRLAEPVVGPWLADVVREVAPQRALDIGCGSAVNLRWMARAAPAGAELVGIDLSSEAVASARTNLADWGLDRVQVAEADLDRLPDELTARPWDLVLLAQNVYYWPVDERSAVLSRLRDLVAGQGTALVLTAVPSRAAVTRHLDLVLRVTEGCDRLPTRAELETHARDAGFTEVTVRDLMPGAGLVALVARR